MSAFVLTGLSTRTRCGMRREPCAGAYISVRNAPVNVCRESSQDKVTKRAVHALNCVVHGLGRLSIRPYLLSYSIYLHQSGGLLHQACPRHF